MYASLKKSPFIYCINCKRYLDHSGLWLSVSEYSTILAKETISHGLCPECSNQLYDEFQILANAGDSPENIISNKTKFH